MSIDKIRNIGLDKLVTQVYDFDSLTTDELMCKFAQKINIIIEHFNYLDDRCYNSDKALELKLDYLLNQGLEEQVARRLLELINNGTLGKLINETLLKDINEKLKTKADQNEVNKRLKFRNFKPKFGYNCYWGEIWGTDGTHTQKTRNEISNDLNHCDELGLDEITVDIHVGYNSNTSSLYIATNMTDVLWAIESCNNLNVKIKNAKIHVGIDEDYLKNTITLPVFLTLYKAIVSEICVQLKNTTIENVTVLNECAFIDTDPTYTTDVLELLNIAKNNGFKVGITCAGVEHNYRLPGVVLGLSDLLCVNCYPTISFKKDKTTYEDSINAWKQHEVNLWIKTRKEQYPNKKIIISETGITNCWEALISPASNVANSTVSNKATEIYLKGLFEVLNKDDLSSVWWWFGIFTEGTNIQKMFDYELRGLINE